MSGIARQMLGISTILNTVSGSLFGSGSLLVPVGATLVTLLGQGGTGGDNSYYDPGQPFITATWSGHWEVSNNTYGILMGSDVSSAYPSPPTAEGQTTGYFSACVMNSGGGAGEEWTCILTGLYAVTDSSTPGQPYIPPSSGGGPYSGDNTTATLNGVTRTWLGGYATIGTPSTQTLASTGAGQTLTYSVGSGGYINYSYTY